MEGGREGEAGSGDGGGEAVSGESVNSPQERNENAKSESIPVFTYRIRPSRFNKSKDSISIIQTWARKTNWLHSTIATSNQYS